MRYKIFIEKGAERDAAKIPAHYRINIDKIILSLTANPRPRGCKKLTDREGYRIRVGNYRILYMVDDEAQLVVVYRIKIKGKATYR